MVWGLALYLGAWAGLETAAASAVVWEEASETVLVDGAVPAMEVVMVDTEEDTVDTAVADAGRATDVAVAVRTGAAADTGNKLPRRKETGLCRQ